MTRRLLAVVAALGVIVAACGIPEDSEPRTLSAAQLAGDAADPAEATPTPAQAPTEQTQIYLVDAGGVAVSVEAEIVGPDDPGKAIAALIEGLDEEEANELGVRSAVPQSTVLLEEPAVDDGVVTINVGPEGLAALEDEASRLAMAQLVWTATEFEQVDRLLLQIEGVPSPVPTDEGVSPENEAVDRMDYPSFDPFLAPS